MKNMHIIKSMEIKPVHSKAHRWSVTISVPVVEPDGAQNTFDKTKHGWAETFSGAHAEVVKFVESIKIKK